MSKIIWTRPALADLERLLDFLKHKNPNAAQRAARAIRKGGDDLGHMPKLGKPMPDDTGRREYIVAFGRGGYVLRYMLDGSTPVILRVWHTLEWRA